MEYLKDYIKIMAYMLIGLVFAIASFYLFINVFHSLEISREYPIVMSDATLVNDYDQRIKTIEKNISTFQVSTYKGEVNSTKMMLIQQNLKQCTLILKDTYLEEIRNNTSIDIVDVYKLRDSYENKILSDCIINNLYWTLSLKENNISSTYLENNQELLKMYVNSLKNKTSYLKKDLLNNSSYFFNTSTANSGVSDDIRDGLYEVLDAYKDASLYVEYLSEWFKNEVGGA